MDALRPVTTKLVDRGPPEPRTVRPRRYRSAPDAGLNQAPTAVNAHSLESPFEYPNQRLLLLPRPSAPVADARSAAPRVTRGAMLTLLLSPQRVSEAAAGLGRQSHCDGLAQGLFRPSPRGSGLALVLWRWRAGSVVIGAAALGWQSPSRGPVVSHPRRERSIARATCSRERALTAQLSARRQRSGVAAEHCNPRSVRTAA